MRLDEWVISRPQLHLSSCTWHPKSLLQSIQANLCQRFCLWIYVKHIFHGIEFTQIKTFRWTKWDGAIKPFHVSFWVVQLYSSLGKKFVPRMMSYLTLLLSNTSTFCWLMCPFLIELWKSDVLHRDNFLCLNSLTAIGGPDRQLFFELRARVVSPRIFVRSQSLIAPWTRNDFSLPAVSCVFYEALLIDDVSRGSKSYLFRAS